MWSRILAVHGRLITQGASSGPEICLLLLLIPFAILYGMIVWIRNLFYDWGFRPVYQSPFSVVSVGNLAAGGTGKTPVVDFLVRELKTYGYSVVILSRGYGGCFAGKAGCVSNGGNLLMDPESAGDEPFLLASRNPGVPVFVARQRKDGFKLIEKMLPGTDVIILDDGFQHRSVARDCNIVLLDYRRPFGNGWPLPAGILREFSLGLRRADVVIFTRADREGRTCYKSIPAFYASYGLGNTARSVTGEVVALDQLKGTRLCAFAGIAHPDSFFQSLEEMGIEVSERVSYRDHVAYSSELLRSLESSTLSEAFVTTEKDAVKLVPGMLKRPCYQIPLALKIADKEMLMDTVIHRISGAN